MPMRCPECGFENNPDASFCEMCGTPMPKVSPAKEVAEAAPVLRCPKCGAVVEPGDRFCVMCGANLAQPSGATAPADAPGDAAGQAPEGEAVPDVEEEPAPASLAGGLGSQGGLDAAPRVSALVPPACEEPGDEWVEAPGQPEVGEAHVPDIATEPPAQAVAESAPVEAESAPLPAEAMDGLEPAGTEPTAAQPEAVGEPAPPKPGVEPAPAKPSVGEALLEHAPAAEVAAVPPAAAGPVSSEETAAVPEADVAPAPEPGSGLPEQPEPAPEQPEPASEPLLETAAAPTSNPNLAPEAGVSPEPEPVVSSDITPEEVPPAAAVDAPAAEEPADVPPAADQPTGQPAPPRYVAFCPRCGWRNADGVHFCANCGADLTKGAPVSAAPVATPSPDATVIARAAVPAPTAQPAAAPDVQQAGKGKPRTPLIVAACIAAAVALGGGIAWKVSADQQQAAYEQAHRQIDVGLTIEAPNYTSGATRIPLHVTGTDLDGTAVDEVQYVSPDTPQIVLMQGDYDVSVQASPILEDGSLYVVPDTVVVVSLHDEAPQADAATGDGTSADQPASGDGSAQADDQGTTDNQGTAPDPASQTITFTVADPTQVTDEMIAAARKAAEGDEQSADKADDLAQKATQVRDEAVEAQAEAARQAKIQTVQDNAIGFVKAYFGNTKLGDVVTDSFGTYYETTYIPDWQTRALRYVAQSSWVYSSLQSDEMGSLGYMDAWLACKSATVTQANETSATVSVAYYGGNGYATPDSLTTYHGTVYLAFDDSGLITDVSISYND